MLEPLYPDHQAVDYPSFESPSKTDKDGYIQVQNYYLAELKKREEKLEERESYGDNSVVKELEKCRAAVAAVENRKEVAENFNRFCGRAHSGSGLRTGPSTMLMDWLLLGLPDNRPSDNTVSIKKFFGAP